MEMAGYALSRFEQAVITASISLAVLPASAKAFSAALIDISARIEG